MGVNDRADQTAVIGRSGSGKSHYIKARLDAEKPGRLLIWSPLEKTDNYARYGQLITHDIKKLIAAVASKRGDPFSLVFVPDRSDDERLAAQFNLFCGLAIAAGKVKPIALLVEELSLVTRPGWSPVRWRLISTEGRHHGITSIGTSQRPALIDKTYFGGATMIRCGALQTKGDKATMADAMDITVDDIRQLRPGEWIVKEVYTGAITREGQPIADIGKKPARKRPASK